MARSAYATIFSSLKVSHALDFPSVPTKNDRARLWKMVAFEKIGYIIPGTRFHNPAKSVAVVAVESMIPVSTWNDNLAIATLINSYPEKQFGAPSRDDRRQHLTNPIRAPELMPMGGCGCVNEAVSSVRAPSPISFPICEELCVSCLVEEKINSIYVNCLHAAKNGPVAARVFFFFVAGSPVLGQIRSARTFSSPWWRIPIRRTLRPTELSVGKYCHHLTRKPLFLNAVHFFFFFFSFTY